MKVIPDFENELKALDPGLTIVQNPNRPLICNIKLNGTDICPIPSGEIRDERDPAYCIEMPNGMLVPHRSRREAIDLVKHTLEILKNPQEADAFYGRNGY